MPGKRSKSEERERKRLYRQNRTAEQTALAQEKDRNKKKEEWNRKTIEEREEDNEKKRVRMSLLRAGKSTEVRAYERIVDRQEKRIMRKGLSGKEHLERNLKAKKGMSLLKSEGRLRKFARREPGMKIAKIDERTEVMP